MAQGGDGTEFNQIEHSIKPNLTQQTGREITLSSKLCSLMQFTAQVHKCQGGSESEQLGTRMVGLTMLETGQIYVRFK